MLRNLGTITDRNLRCYEWDTKNFQFYPINLPFSLKNISGKKWNLQGPFLRSAGCTDMHRRECPHPLLVPRLRPIFFKCFVENTFVGLYKFFW